MQTSPLINSGKLTPKQEGIGHARKLIRYQKCLNQGPARAGPGRVGQRAGLGRAWRVAGRAGPPGRFLGRKPIFYS